MAAVAGPRAAVAWRCWRSSARASSSRCRWGAAAPGAVAVLRAARPLRARRDPRHLRDLHRLGALRRRARAPPRPGRCAARCSPLLPLNTVYGAQWKDWYQDRVDTFAADVAQGVPLAELIRYRPLGWDPEEMWIGMQYLRAREVGVFARVRLVPPPRRGWAIDGFAGGGAGWETLRGRDEPREPRHPRRAARDALGVRGDAPRAGGPRAAASTGRRTGAAAVRWRSPSPVRRRSGACAYASRWTTPQDGLERFDTWFTDTTARTRTRRHALERLRPRQRARRVRRRAEGPAAADRRSARSPSSSATRVRASCTSGAWR